MEPAVVASVTTSTLCCTYFPVPTLGLVPVNAFVLQAHEPVLINRTGLDRPSTTSSWPRCNPSWIRATCAGIWLRLPS